MWFFHVIAIRRTWGVANRAIIDSIPRISHRPTGATERAPERSQIGNRKLFRPGGRVIMAVDVARACAVTGRGQLSPKNRLPGHALICPSRVAPKAAHRRPVR